MHGTGLLKSCSSHSISRQSGWNRVRFLSRMKSPRSDSELMLPSGSISHLNLSSSLLRLSLSLFHHHQAQSSLSRLVLFIPTYTLFHPVFHLPISVIFNTTHWHRNISVLFLVSQLLEFVPQTFYLENHSELTSGGCLEIQCEGQLLNRCT